MKKMLDATDIKVIVENYLEKPTDDKTYILKCVNGKLIWVEEVK